MQTKASTNRNIINKVFLFIRKAFLLFVGTTLGLTGFILLFMGRDCLSMAIICIAITVWTIHRYGRIGTDNSERSDSRVSQVKNIVTRSLIGVKDGVQSIKNSTDKLVEYSVPSDGIAQICQNCGKEFTGRYCPDCGQDITLANRSIKDTILAFLAEVTNCDSKALRALVELLFHPGKMLNKYLDGKYERYSNPIKFVLFAGVAYTLMTVIFPASSINQFVSDGSKIENAFLNLSNNLPLFLSILSVAVNALPLYLIYRRTEFGSSLRIKDFIMCIIYMCGITIWIKALFCPLLAISYKFIFIQIAATLVYQFVAIKELFCLDIKKAILSYIPYTILSEILLAVCIFPISLADVFHEDRLGRMDPMFNHVYGVLTGLGNTDSVDEMDLQTRIQRLNFTANAGEDRLGTAEYSIKDGGLELLFIESDDYIIDLCGSQEQRDHFCADFLNKLKECEQGSEIRDLFVTNTKKVVLTITNQTRIVSITIPIDEKILSETLFPSIKDIS